MAQSPLDIQVHLLDMPRHPDKHLPKYDLEKGTTTEDHMNKFYLALQMVKVQHDNVACRLFPHILENKAATWYHSLPMASVGNWGKFQNAFL